MSIRLLVAVGLRFVAVALCFNALTSLVSIGALRAAGLAAVAPLLALFYAGVLAMAVVLWATARPLSGLFLSGLPRESLGGLASVDLVVAGCALLGLWWLKFAVGGLVELWVRAQMLTEVSGQSAWRSPDARSQGQAVTQVFDLAIALLFLLRPRQIGQWILRVPTMARAGDDI